MTIKQPIVSNKLPKAIGPYSMAIRSGDLIFTSGQLGVESATGELVSGGAEAETRQALRNLDTLLDAAGSSMARVLKTTVFLRDLADFTKMNAVYAEFFPVDPPARSTIQAAALPKGAAVEIECIATISSP